MFFEGNLQSGIAKAVQGEKSVLCFVTNGNEESELWEKDWLQSDDFPEKIPATAVALRIEAGSQEASYLSAFCPLSHIPCIVVIIQNKVEEKLNSGIDKYYFVSFLRQALRKSEVLLQAPTQSTSNEDPTRVAAAAPAGGLDESQEAPVAEPMAASTVPSQPPAIAEQPETSSSSASASSLTADRRSRVEAQQAQVLAAERAERSKTNERARIRREAAESIPTEARPNDRISDPDVVAQQAAYARQERSRLKAEQAERNRIRKQVEQDKLERRERAEYRQRAAQAAKASAGDDASTMSNIQAQTPSQRASSYSTASITSAPAKDTRIAVRLLDSTTLRHTAPPSSTLSSLRAHINAHRTDGDAPYSLKHLLTPSPSRTFTDGDDAQTLQELGLHPSATLVMSPVQGFVAAYSQTPGAPVAAARTAVQTLWEYATRVLMLLLGWIRTFLGIGAAEPQGRASERAEGMDHASTTGVGSGRSEGSGIRIRTLRDQGKEKTEHDKEKQPLYNGNQLNFEPRDDEAAENEKDV